jgi:hypothetical protein
MKNRQGILGRIKGQFKTRSGSPSLQVNTWDFSAWVLLTKANKTRPSGNLIWTLICNLNWRRKNLLLSRKES